MKRYIRSDKVDLQSTKVLKNKEQREGYLTAQRLMKKYSKAMKVLAQ